MRSQGIASNTLWPRTTIDTAAIRNVLGGEAVVRMSRTPDIVADAACLVFRKPARAFTGRFLIDDSFLYDEGGVRDFARYSVAPGVALAPDFFVPSKMPRKPSCDSPHDATLGSQLLARVQITLHDHAS